MANHVKNIFVIYIAFQFLACGIKNRDENVLPPPLYPQPKIVPLKMNGGYQKNQLTGDAISPIINSYGDTIPTGVPIRINGTVVNLDSMPKPRVVKAPAFNQLPKIKAHPNRKKIPENISSIRVSESMFKTFFVDSLNSDFVMLNSKKDTCPTGKPVTAVSEIFGVNTSSLYYTLPPLVKENAVFDVQYIDIRQGLKTSAAKSLVEDHSGNLWIGLHGGYGLVKYDGNSFQDFPLNYGNYVTNVVFDLTVDKNNNLWVGAESGIYCYNGKTFEFF